MASIGPKAWSDQTTELLAKILLNQGRIEQKLDVLLRAQVGIDNVSTWTQQGPVEIPDRPGRWKEGSES